MSLLYKSIFNWFAFLKNILRWLLLTSYFSMMNVTSAEHSDSDSEYCDYDSTWEEEMNTAHEKTSLTKWNCRNTYAARDMQEFRYRYKIAVEMDSHIDMDVDSQTSHQEDFHNLNFYKGQRLSDPDGFDIYEFHNLWWGDYYKLEEVHSYIQWLFPLQEQGMNWLAHVLTEQEIKLFRKDETAKRNLLESYKLMLNFYGIRLVNEDTGDVEREENWEERFKNLNRYTHNNLRITRILKCMGILGFEHYQAKLVKFFLHETLVKETLPNVKKSVLDYFIFSVLDKQQRKDLVRYAFKHFQPKSDFVWGPRKLLSSEMNEHGKTDEENKSTASEENSMLEEKESSSEREETVTPVRTTSNTEDVPKIDSVLDREKTEAMASKESSTLESIEIHDEEVTPSSLIGNPAEDATDEQNLVSSQSNFTPQQNDQGVSLCQENMEDISVKKSDKPDSPVQCMKVPKSDMTGETSKRNDETFQERTDEEQASSKSAPKEENGHGKHV